MACKLISEASFRLKLHSHSLMTLYPLLVTWLFSFLSIHTSLLQSYPGDAMFLNVGCLACIFYIHGIRSRETRRLFSRFGRSHPL